MADLSPILELGCVEPSWDRAPHLALEVCSLALQPGYLLSRGLSIDHQ